MKTILLQIFILIAIQFIAQQNDIKNILKIKKWTYVSNETFGDSIVNLEPLLQKFDTPEKIEKYSQRFDTTGRTFEEIKKIAILISYTPSLWIDAVNNFQHRIPMECPVGAKWNEITRLRVENEDILIFHYKEYHFENYLREEKIWKYKVLELKENSIKLKKIKE